MILVELNQLMMNILGLLIDGFPDHQEGRDFLEELQQRL